MSKEFIRARSFLGNEGAGRATKDDGNVVLAVEDFGIKC
jgi:hypothetical protein